MDILKNSAAISLLVLMISAFYMISIKDYKRVLKVSLISISVALVLSIINIYYVLTFGEFEFLMGHFAQPFGIVMRVGPIEAIIGGLFVFITLMVVWYSYFTVEKELKANRIKIYYILINMLLMSLVGIVYTGDIFNGFVLLEISTIASCGIIVVKDKKENLKATMKYLILSTLGSGLFLMGIAYLYSITGQLDFVNIGTELSRVHMDYPKLITISITIITIGLGIKSAMFPLHIWLPDAHTSAPSTSSALLSAIVIKAPVILLYKVIYQVYGVELLADVKILSVLVIFGSVGMLMGSLFARSQKNIKRMIAYSSVAQMGYIFLGLGLGNNLGTAVALYHIIGHSFTKSALFLAVGSIIEQTGEKKIEKLRGIGKEMPITLAIFTIGALSMVGIPVLPGFISKWNLALASIEAGSFILLGVILLSSLLNATYYFPIVINGYFGESNLEGKILNSKAKPVVELIPVIILTGGLVIVGLMSGPIINIFSNAL